ncbi:MAG: sugar-binding domain-containing protein [Verrucomicrobiota bacterium]
MNLRIRLLSYALLSSLPASAAEKSWQMGIGPLTTPWTEKVSPQNALPEYPRPQLTRDAWQSLNGLWDHALTDISAADPPANLNESILVPYPYESMLSGVGKKSIPNKRLWYRRSFTVPPDWKGRQVLLHFGAVNWDSTVMVNRKKIGSHRGGFDGFSIDITDALKSGENELVVSASNPLKVDTEDAQVLGKQRAKPGGIFYTGATGIWRSVWMEPVPKAHISDLNLTPDLDAFVLKIKVAADGGGKFKVKAIAYDGKTEIGQATGDAGADLSISIKDAKPWSPDSPSLYDLKVSIIDGDKVIDEVGSYFAMRRISLGKDDKDQTRILLNNKFTFQVGALDQGYWPDGIYTAPTDDALKSDIEMAKKLGFNLLRKHAKTEPDRWYYWADKLGMLVWQDMPQMYGSKDGALSDSARKQFENEWREILRELHNHPSIILWTPFNEGWGQHDTERIVALTKSLDPSRLVCPASGWNDVKTGDVQDTHHYPEPSCELPSERAVVNGEYGGLGMVVDGHMWSDAAWGYQGVYKKAYPLTKRYQSLQKAVYQLMAGRGMSASVYTQLTDVEVEGNGLITYDRRVVKPDSDIVSAANQGNFPEIPPDPHPDLLPTSMDEPARWSYTTENPGDAWMEPGTDVSTWKTAPAPFGNRIAGMNTPWTTPDIWMRREFELKDDIPATLALSIIHDEDAEVFINGVAAAAVVRFTGGYVTVPLSQSAIDALLPGKNVISVHCHQTDGAQGIDVGLINTSK